MQQISITVLFFIVRKFPSSGEALALRGFESKSSG
jgi:hypothetical protein